MTAQTAPPLSGIKVIEISRVLAGPFAAQTLADLGAEVIKIESPNGDDTRGWGPPFYEYEASNMRDAAYYYSCNHSKQVRFYDFNDEAQKAELLTLIKASDVLIENFKKGGLKKYGLDYDSIAAINPRLVYCSITGFGQDGPYAAQPGYDLLIQGMSGMMSITGTADGQPQKIGVALADVMTGLYAAIAIEAALIEREKSGLGQQIDMALLDCMIASLTNQAQNYLATGIAPFRKGNAHPNIVPYQLFNAKDKPFLLSVGNDSQFIHLCAEFGIAQIASQTEYCHNQARVQNRAQLTEYLQAIFNDYMRDKILEKCLKAGVPAGPVNDIAEALSDPQVTARGMVQSVEVPHLKEKIIKIIKSPIKFSRSRLRALSANHLGRS